MTLLGMARGRAAAALMAVVVVFRVACGGGDGEAPPDDGGPLELTHEQRQLVYRGVDAAADAARDAGGGPEAQAVAVDASPATRPEMAGHGLADSRITWARWVDGRLLLVGSSRVTDDTELAPSAAPAAARRARPQAATELPGGWSMRLFNVSGSGTEYKAQTDVLRPLVVRGIESPARVSSTWTRTARRCPTWCAGRR